MNSLSVSASELRAGFLAPETLARAVAALREEGFVVLEDVIAPAHLAVLREQMLKDVAAITSRDDVPFQFTRGHIQQDPPPHAPFLFEDVLLNPLVIQVTKAILGPGLKNQFYSGNTNLPGSPAQPVHTDSGQLWPNLEQAHPAYALVVNVPVVDMDEHNGSTELWPQTHLDTTMFIQQGDEIKVPADKLEGQRQIVPPLQPKVRAGSVLVRDMRMWHRGVPNHSDSPRPMIAMIHVVGWWEPRPLYFPKEAEAFFGGVPKTKCEIRSAGKPGQLFITPSIVIPGKARGTRTTLPAPT